MVSVWFVLFFMAVLIAYYLIPNKIKNVWLLISSYLFYIGLGGGKSVLFIIGITFLTYFSGRLLVYFEKKSVQVVLLVVNVSILVSILFLLRLYKNGIVAPIGLSFFSLQAIGYLIDVFKRKINVETNLLHYALFLSFFVYILSGPIESAKNMLPQINRTKENSYKDFSGGLQWVLWGFFLKLVIAERLYIVVSNVYSDYTYFAGIELFIATIVYSFYIYCDFMGYSYIAIGMGKALGFNITENFRQPYFSMSIAEFWRRWHISLSTWLKEYIYIPLGGSRVSKLKKYRNILIVFLVSGLWHGTNWNFLVWGMLHGVYQIIGDLSHGLRKKIVLLLRIKDTNFSFKFFKCLITFLCVNFAWIFFYFENCTDAINIIKRIIWGWSLKNTVGVNAVPEYPWVSVIGSNLVTTMNHLYWNMGLDIDNIFILCISILLMVIVDIYHKKGKSCKAWLAEQNILFRWIIYLAGIFTVLTYGIYGSAYDVSSFIYSNF